MARRMVTEWGMSEQLGRLRYSDNEEEIFLGRSITRSHNVSEDTARIIDAEVRRIIERAEDKARGILTEHLDDLHKIAAALLEFETLSGDDVQRVLRGEPIDRPDASDPGTHDRPSPRKVSVPVGGQGSRRPESGSVPGLHSA
jgi:cell division protease FtsH